MPEHHSMAQAKGWFRKNDIGQHQLGCGSGCPKKRRLPLRLLDVDPQADWVNGFEAVRNFWVKKRPGSVFERASVWGARREGSRHGP